MSTRWMDRRQRCQIHRSSGRIYDIDVGYKRINELYEIGRISGGKIKGCVPDPSDEKNQYRKSLSGGYSDAETV